MITETPSLALPRVLPLPPDLLAELRQRLGFAGSAVLLVMGDGSQASGGLPQPARILGVKDEVGRTKDAGEGGAGDGRAECGGQSAESRHLTPALSPVEAERESVRENGAQNVYRRAGSHWDVGFGGGDVFHVEDSLGAQYVDHLLHRPGEVIAAFDLEVAICPEKGHCRTRDSIQLQLDPETARSYLRELTRLRGERERANEHGDHARAEQHDEEIGALEEALQVNGHTTSDTGERARNNVRKAVRKFIARRERGGRRERALAAHLAQCVSLGFQVSYQPVGGEVWG